jgi:catechol 2,3-dioxygenase-like lactoylglutathione lyase family enzyme
VTKSRRVTAIRPLVTPRNRNLDMSGGVGQARAMRVTGLNHVSISSVDVEESVRFYTEVLGLERIDTYTFAFPTQYMRLGDVQLHVFQREETDAPPFHHIGLNVDDFEGAYLKARELGVLDDTAFFSPIYELPDGSVQLYLRDPGGNLVELDWPDVTMLDRQVFGEIPKLAHAVPQTEEGMRATLYHLRRDSART